MDFGQKTPLIFGAQCQIYLTAELSALVLTSSLSQSRYQSPNDNKDLKVIVMTIKSQI